MAGYIIAHDVGTSGNKAVLVDTEGRVHGRHSESYGTEHPAPGYAEQRPADWWHAVATATRSLLEKTGTAPGDILCMTFSTQMLGVTPMDAAGEPLRPAIIWLDSRAGTQARRMMRKFLGPRVFARVAGAALGGKDGLPKLLWLKDQEPEVYRQMQCFLDVNGYLLYRCTGSMVMEWSCASVFGIDLKKKRWLEGIFRYIGLDPRKFPSLVRSTESVGGLSREAAAECGLLAGTPVIAGAGDAPSAAVGSGAVGEGEGHVYLGTSGWVGVVTKRTPKGKHGAACIHSADPGKAFLFAESEAAGACLQWASEHLYGAEKRDSNTNDIYALMDEKVGQVPPGSGNLIFTPWIYGERVPVDDHNVRASFLNLGIGHTREHLLRAVYEGVAYNMRWVLKIVERDFGFSLPRLRVVGGGARGGPWMQILADVTRRDVEAVQNPEDAGAVGAALIAAVGLGIYPDFESLRDVVRLERVFEPRPENYQTYDTLFRSYQEVYGSLRRFYRRLNMQKRNETRPDKGGVR